MPDGNDLELLAEYAERGREEAFTTLTHRYVGLVYAAAFRQVHDPHLAEEVTQTVFIILARKARALRPGTVLSGWLLRATRFTAANLLLSQNRRVRRERAAAELRGAPPDEPPWEQLAPFLDEALAALGNRDRNALALRFFGSRSLSDVGAALGIDADTARKRVARAIERLRRILLNRRVALSGAAIVSALSAQGGQTAPAGLATSVAAAARGSILQGVTASSATNSALLKATLRSMARAKLKTATAVVVLVTLAGGTVLLVLAVAGFFGSPLTAAANARLRLPVGSVTPRIGLGESHGVILAAEGSLWSWGESYAGWPVLGLGGINTQLCLRRIGTATNWIRLAVGETHNLAIKADGTLWGWGENIYGQLGEGSVGRWNWSRNTPVPSAPGNDWKEVAAGGSHSVGLKRDGTLWSWGNNWGGQLGIGRTLGREIPEAVQVGAGTNWVRVWAGTLETVGQQSDGTLWYWGDNPNPAIPMTGASASNMFTPVRISAETNWTGVAFGPWTVLAVRTDGTLWAWGRQAHAYTGATDPASDAAPMRVGTNRDWQSISGDGWSYRALTKQDGSLWGLRAEWVNPGATVPPLELTRIELSGDIVAIAGTGRTPWGVGLTREGEVWTWGRVLGLHTPTNGVLKSLAKAAQRLQVKARWGESEPVTRRKPWRLAHEDPANASAE